MSIKKVVATVMSTVLISGMFKVSYAIVPQSNGLADFGEQLVLSGTKSWTPSPAENIFSVDGKKFILLDTDAEGNYFVLTEDHYGGYPIDAGKTSTAIVQKAETVNGVTTFTDVNEDLGDAGIFDTKREGSVGYWLNNGFLAEGNTSQHVLPEKIKSNIIEKTWDIESYQAVRGWTAASYYDNALGVTKGRDYAASYTGQSRSVTGKIALISYTEYMAYKDKIGVEFSNSAGWAGMPLRTTDAMTNASVSGDVRTLSVNRAPLMVKTKNADKTNKSELIMSYADGISSSEYFIRPCFYLDKDFFKNVACDITYDQSGNLEIGSNVINTIKKHSYNDLKSIYSHAFLQSLGFSAGSSIKLGIYPEHPTAVADIGAGEAGATGLPAYYESPKENLFTVGDKSFILLDTDSEGNFFVMANEEYGQRLFSTTPTGKASKESDWYFDPENSKSIAYWLNNDFLKSGNAFKGETTRHKLPDAIQEGLIEYEWDIEPHYPIKGWTVKDYLKNNPTLMAEVDTWISNQIADAKPRTVKCKVALMSYTEYKTYKEKIGLKVVAGGYAGFSLRTPRAQAGADKSGTSWGVTVGQLQVAISGDNLKYSTCGSHNDIYYVRPVMWLNRDFFKNNALDVSLIGDNVKRVIASSYDYYDLRDKYSKEQIKELGVGINTDETSAVPDVENVIISGVTASGSKVVGEYAYIPKDKGIAASERNSCYGWYVSDTADGVKTKISDNRVLDIDTSLKGKYITFGVVPENAWGIAGAEKFSRPAQVLDNGISVNKIVFTDKYGKEITSPNGYGEISAEITADSGYDGIVFMVLYDMNGKLQKIVKQNMTQDEHTITMTGINPGGGAKVKLMIFNKDDLVNPLYTMSL